LFRNDPLLTAATLLRPRLARLALAIALGTLSLGSALALAGVAAWLITRAWQMPPVLDLTIAVVAVRAFGIARGVLGYCERLASHDTALRAAGTARAQLYRALADAPAEAVMCLHSGDLLSRMGTSVDELSDVLVRAVLPIAVATVLSAVAVGVIAAISPAAALILACCLLMAGVVAPWLSARSAATTEDVAAAHHAARDAATMLALEHAPELKVGGRLDEVIAEATRRQRDWGTATDRAARPAAVASAAPTAAVGVSVLGAVLVAMSIAPTVAPTTLAVLMLLPLSAFEATTALPGAAIALTRARIAAQRLRQLVAPTPLARSRQPLPPLQVRPGDRLAVVGPSGCGKTTLLMATAASHSGSTSTAGYFAEDAHVFATTLRDNLLVARGDAADSELIGALCRVGLGPWLDDLPDGLSTMLVGGAAAISAGQRRRLLLARALISSFPIVLLDEPTENLDADDGRRILTDLLTANGLFPADRAVVVASHHLPDEIDCPIVALGHPDGSPYALDGQYRRGA
jgi:ATP-binding cassette, subfamily C, bacterial CydC